MDSLFADADIIHTYSRAQAIEDGVLVELDAKTCKEAGMRFPVAVTRSVFESCIALTPKAEEMGCDVVGRTWDVLTMLKHTIRKAEGSELAFEALVVRDRKHPTLTQLAAVCGPGDNMEPVITISFPGED